MDQWVSIIPRASGADGRSVSAPGTGINELEVKIDIGGQVVADAQSGHLLDELIIRFTERGCWRNAGGITLSSRSNPAAETDVVAVFWPYAEIGAHPEVSEVEVSADFWVERFVGFFLGDTTADDDRIGDLFPFGQFEGALGRTAKGNESDRRRHGREEDRLPLSPDCRLRNRL